VDDEVLDVTLEPRLGDGQLLLADAEQVRGVPAGCVVHVHLREIQCWESGVPELVGRWLSDCIVTYRLELSSVRAGREFARLARGAKSALLAVEAGAIAQGLA